MGVESAMSALISIALLLVIGLVMTAISRKIQVSNLFLLLLSGVLLSFLNRLGYISLFFTDVLLISLAIITLVMVVFEGTSTFNIKRLENISIPALKLVGWFILLSLIFVSPMVGFIFFDGISLTNLLFGAIIAVVMAGTDPSTVFTMLKTGANKVVQILELESIFNTPFTIILPLIFIELIQASTSSSAVISDLLFGQFKPLILEITAGIGLGIIFGYFVAKNFKKFYSSAVAPIALLTFVLVAYLGAELIGGSGVLSVATMGIVFGSFAIKNSEDLHSFNETLTSIFVFLVFILAGFIVDTSITGMFILKVLFIVIIGILVRFVSIDIVLRKKDFTLKEKFFMSVMMPKGIAVAVVALSLAVMDFVVGFEPMVSLIVQIILVSMVISLFFSTIVAHFSKKLLFHQHQEVLEQQIILKTIPQQEVLEPKKTYSTKSYSVKKNNIKKQTKKQTNKKKSSKK